ncbi:hypothetical protein H6F67_13330 [Microcoleus sp. FACHB-1515]|uniref:hypothetical protein n=1 Tax=Cyanophyceae TaxID=3028117 RepID=UPI001689A442|nr:hypothetical protein [Microcoleus sp. FACHB-1515]MBD2090832.1 hypothetical protein [Microcoleus sp. FACHB-1515]
MLVILMENQILQPKQVCQSCLMADPSGQPRWTEGQLRCGRALVKLGDRLPDQFECQMGFRIANIE